MSNVYMYVVDRDFGFAPNPFHNICTLATCKPDLRRVAKKEDWVIGMGGGRLNATGQCVFAMKVSDSITFDEYWNNPLYKDKKPAPNGSKKMIVGDNIYHQDDNGWQQANSHHSNPDGSPNLHNIKKDTRANAVLISNHFFYFGEAAVEIPAELLNSIGYSNKIGHWKFSQKQATPLILFFEKNYKINIVYGDPFDFGAASSKYSAENNRLTART
jgi:hypothetical protein